MGRKAREDRSSIVGEFERSGMTQQAFADRCGIPVSTLRSWIYRARTKERPRAVVPRLVPVQVVGAPARSGAGAPEFLEFAIGDSIVLRFPMGTDPRYLAELVSAVA